MVDTIDGVEEHSGVNPILSTGDGGTSISYEEFNVALETLKTSMTTEVESMFTKFLEGIKLSTAPLKVGNPTDKVTMLPPIRGKLVVKRLLLLVVRMAPVSLLMWNHHLFTMDRFLHSFESCRSSP